MPLYMDVHRNIHGDPDEVALAHDLDLQIQERYDVRYTRYWYDEAKSCVFCLVEAPSIGSAIRVHKEAHGLIPERVIEVAPDQVDAFLGEEAPTPTGTDPLDGGFRAVMFTDIEGSTALTAALGDQRYFELLRDHDAIVREALAAHDGREVKHTGDGFLASFRSAVHGVRCAIGLQRALAARSVGPAETPLRVRVGLAAGEPVESNDDLFGTTVNLAARICGHAEAAQILASDVVRGLCIGQRIAFAALEPVSLKGFADAVPLYEVSWR